MTIMESICGQLKLENEQAIIAAVSGGSDSIGLLINLADYLKKLEVTQPVPRLVAVTVDHDLRAESAAEAASVAQFCAQRNIHHITKIWSADKPATGLSDAARRMRYALLGEAAREVGAQMIFTGHSQDDQVETYIMRSSRSSRSSRSGSEYLRGHAGMAAFTMIEREFLLVRPLLNTRREALRDQLHARSIGWIDDPTNLDTHYERPRIRKARKESEHVALLDLIAQAAQKRQAVNQQAADYFAANPEILEHLTPDIAVIDKTLLAAMPQEAAHVFIGFVLALAGGKNLLPRTEDRALLYRKMVQGEVKQQRMNYAGCIIELGLGQHRIWRERRNLPAMVVEPNTKKLWDQRYWIENKSDAPIEIHAPELHEFHAFCKSHALKRQEYFQPAVLSSPAIYKKNQLCALPALGISDGCVAQIIVSKHYALLDNVLTGHDFILAERFYQHFAGNELNPAVNICRKLHKNRL